VLLLAACEVTPSEQFTPQLVVHGQLQVGSTNGLFVQVNHTYRPGESYDWNFSGPNIYVSNSVATTRPVGRSGDEHNFFQPVLPVRPGDTFTILVTDFGFDTVRGSTVVPDTFHMLYPQNGDTVTLYDSLGWTRSRTAAGYYFSVEDVNDEFYDFVISNDSTGPNYDSTKVGIPSMFLYYGTKPGWKLLVVSAVDSNYYDWMRLVGYGAGGGTPPETTHLTGGLGVFGSAAVETLHFYLAADTTFGTGPDSELKSQDAQLRLLGRGGLGQRTGCATVRKPSRPLPSPASRR
jgi:hypothetical protein